MNNTAQMFRMKSTNEWGFAESFEGMKAAFQAGEMAMVDAMAMSRHFGFNMTKMGKNKATGMGGKVVWFKR